MSLDSPVKEGSTYGADEEQISNKDEKQLVS